MEADDPDIDAMVRHAEYTAHQLTTFVKMIQDNKVPNDVKRQIFVSLIS